MVHPAPRAADPALLVGRPGRPWVSLLCSQATGVAARHAIGQSSSYGRQFASAVDVLERIQARVKAAHQTGLGPVAALRSSSAVGARPQRDTGRRITGLVVGT